MVKNDELFKSNAQFMILGVDETIDRDNVTPGRFEPASPNNDETVTQ